MDSRVLFFPSVAPTAKPPLHSQPASSQAAPGTSFSIEPCGPQLLRARRPRRAAFSPRAQAEWIAEQVDWEMARRVERETAERHRMCGSVAPYTGPVQATEVTLRHRVLDAVLFAGRPA